MSPKLDTIEAIRFWKRFIDDVVGIWRGTKRSFDNFLKTLNNECMKYGILFPFKEAQFGKSAHVLDLNVYLEENNQIQYRGYTKPTDSKRYLNPSSFHPKSVFNAIPYSQMLRTIRNNSKPETRTEELELCVDQFKNSGYKEDELVKLKYDAINKPTETPRNSDRGDTLVFPVFYFDGIQEFKKVVYDLENEIQSLIGEETRIMLALKKSSSIGNSVVRNKQLSIRNTVSNQRCNTRGCRQCPLVNDQNRLTINNEIIRIPNNLNCKSKNIIYLWLCKLCAEAYFGRTTQECHDRSSGHRGSFTEDKFEKSALSMHARDVHQDCFSLDNYLVSVVKKVSPNN